jgi:hypothetical protein
MSDRRRRYTSKTVTIALNGTVSTEVNTGGLPLQGIIMPSLWNTAVLTFQASNTSGGTFGDIYDGAGTEINVATAASRAIGLTTSDKNALESFQYIKLRSGTTATPVTQTASRTIIVVLHS